MSVATLKQARRAQGKLADLLQGTAEVHGIGIAKLDAGYALRVNVAEAKSAAAIPAEIDGVPVIAEIAGPIEPL